MQMLAYEVHVQKAFVNFIDLGANSVGLKNKLKKHKHFSNAVYAMHKSYVIYLHTIKTKYLKSKMRYGKIGKGFYLHYI